MIIAEASAGFIVFGYGLSAACGFSQLGAGVDNSFTAVFRKAGPQRLHYIFAEIGPAVDIRGQNLYKEPMIHFLLDYLDCIEKLPQAVERKGTSVNRNDCLLSCHQTIKSQKTYAGRTVNDEIVVIVFNVHQALGKFILPLVSTGHDLLKSAQDHIAQDKVKILCHCLDSFANRYFAQ